MIKDHVAVYSDPEDPLVALLDDIGVPVVHIDQLLDYVEKSPWPRPISTSYSTAILDMIRNKTVFNRVFAFDKTKYGQQLKTWGYTYPWGHLALRELYSHARVLLHDTGERGISRSVLPLNTQWWAISQRTNFAVPKFLYPIGPNETNTKDIIDPIKKSIWSLHDWRNETNFSEEAIKHSFYVERPRGTPIICSFLGGDVGLFFPTKNINVEMKQFLTLAEVASKVFRSKIGEILTFMEDDGVLRFYAFSPTMSSSVDHLDFRERLRQFVNMNCSEEVPLDFN